MPGMEGLGGGGPGGMDMEAMMKMMGGAGGAGGMPDFSNMDLGGAAAGGAAAADGDDEPDSDDEGAPPAFLALALCVQCFPVPLRPCSSSRPIPTRQPAALSNWHSARVPALCLSLFVLYCFLG